MDQILSKEKEQLSQVQGMLLSKINKIKVMFKMKDLMQILNKKKTENLEN